MPSCRPPVRDLLASGVRSRLSLSSFSLCEQDREQPEQVKSGLEAVRVVAVVAGAQHTLALTSEVCASSHSNSLPLSRLALRAVWS